MSSNTTTPGEALHPLVVSLSPPRPGSAVERFLADMLVRGLIDDPTSNKVSGQGKKTALRRVPPVAVNTSSSDSGDTTAYSSDTSSSELTAYSSDSIHEVTDKLGGIKIAAGVNEGSSFTKGKRVDITAPMTTSLSMQRYLVHMTILHQPVSDDIGALIERYTPGRDMNKVTFMLELDGGSNTTWVLGSKCRLLKIEPSSTVAGDHVFSLHPWPIDTTTHKSQPLGEREIIYDHACIHSDGNPPVPDSVTTGLVQYADKSAAAVLLPDHTVQICLQCVNWFEKSWKGTMSMDYKPAVAYAITDTFLDRPRSSGVLALGPMSVQAAFGNATNCFEAPSFLQALKDHLPCAEDESGMIMYLALRPPVLYTNTATGYQVLHGSGAEHWLSFNGWPCKLQPRWSQDIRLVTPETSLWKVRLLSMTFQRFDAEKNCYESITDSDGGIITFGNDGLLVHLDCGTSVTLVPPSLVRHIRTKLWPTARNLEIDAKHQDNPCSLISPEVPFYVPSDDVVAVFYKFKDRSGRVIDVVGPSGHFFSQPNPTNHTHTKDKEGLIFVGPPDVINGEAIFGLNFFQTMFVAFCKPERGDPFVRLAPQWEAQMVQYSPRPLVE